MKKNRRAQARVYFPKNRYNQAATWKQLRYISTETCLKFKRRRPSVPFSLETSWVENIHSFIFFQSKTNFLIWARLWLCAC